MDVILLSVANVHIKQRHACVESGIRFEFTISHCCGGSLTGIILSPRVHVEWRQACCEPEKGFEFAISHCCEMGGIHLPSFHDGGHVNVKSEKRSVHIFSLSQLL